MSNQLKLGKVLLIDGSYLMHRALHVESIFNLRNSRGEGTGGVFQFLRSMTAEMRNHSGYYPLVCWDAGLANRRLEVYPNYKHHLDRLMELDESELLGLENKEDDEYLKEYRAQRAQVIDILRILGIPSFRFGGWEGDDLLYICSKLSDDCIILTDDRDLIQLLSPTTKIARPLRGEFLVYEEYQKDHNDPGMKKYVISKSIVGDGSDNIPKCAKGVGGKTADYIADLMMTDKDWINTLKNSTRKAHRAFVTEESLKQFNINMELIDLSRVEITDEIKSLVINEITTGFNSPDYFRFLGKLGSLEISKIDTNRLVQMLTNIVSRGNVLCQV